MEYHPDRNKDDKNAETKFKEINNAYDTLGNQEKKKQYDMFGST
jgi:DnaJ-class molecular chaperone